MNLFDEADDRSVEASPARKTRAIEQGQGPRAPWLASATSGLLALALLGIAAGPMAAGSIAWLRGSLVVQPGDVESLAWSNALWPGLAGSLLVLAAVVAGQVVAQGGWVRLGAWRRARRPSPGARLASTAGGWLLAVGALAGGVIAALPWLAALPALGARTWSGGLWALVAFTGSVALGALLATLACGLLQRRVAQRRFDHALRMNPSEAREAARQDGGVRRSGGGSSRWRRA